MSVFTRSRRSSFLGVVAVAGASAMILAGCAGTSEPAETSAGPTEEREALTLSIGTVLPQTGSLAYLGPPEEAGVGLAVAEINEADKGITVEVEYGDSGDTDNKAYETTVPRLLGNGVQALIGAASSGVTKLFLDQAVGAGVITFSPANTSPDFTTWDDDNLYWRTAPSDLLQGEVLGNLIAEDGHKALGIIYLNDAYGTGLEAALSETFTATGGEVVASESYNLGDTNFSAQVSSILAENPDAIAVIGFEETATIVPSFVNSGFDGANFYFVDGNISQWGADMPVSIEGSKGTQPGPVLSDDFQERLSAQWLEQDGSELVDFNYAAESYDAVVLLALAALAANSSDPGDIAGALAEVSGGSGDGEKCESFADCADIILDGGTADYDGYSGGVAFDEAGDPTEATIGIFQYGADNIHTRVN
ncbi:ABC transporter substrate-binding protein [Microbacterium sp. zg.Y1090]|uniref:ABC transporter substrate-binding protein n=1 Tax=Microbacterium wangruii TaxID=3049073 RepID=UPI00214CA02D|nr:MULTISPECIES: ABC transporter substrate-binding protein [unclassified Microbacterium]MCR2817904.1 ABC transporter substrate-binding protein [Microbacterium sp. zg.Y1090]MDL5487758.1 ABC transporter substrate-binding protein [Microbacterium sp. zg-Y1211]WIM27927.1 ABC transporter substrate-binding protein [Microbacterium sp. zg-Y1090]